MRYHLLYFFIFFCAAIGQTQTDTCKGLNGKNQKIFKNNDFVTEFKGEFKCDDLINGFIIYRDTLNVVFCKLEFKNGIYSGEIDAKTGKIKKQDPKFLTEDGKKDMNGILVTGKKYIYDSRGLIMAIAVFKDGKYAGDGQIE